MMIGAKCPGWLRFLPPGEAPGLLAPRPCSGCASASNGESTRPDGTARGQFSVAGVLAGSPWLETWLDTVGVCLDRAQSGKACLSFQGSQALAICRGSQDPEKHRVSLSVFRPGLSLLPQPSAPTWLDVPSSLAGTQEGVWSFQEKAWQLEIVSRLLGDQQPNNSGNGGRRRALCRAAKRSSLGPQKTSVPHSLCQSGSYQETETTH